MTTVLGVLVLILGAYLLYKIAGVLLKVVLFLIALVVAYWLLAPVMGWPPIGEVIYVLGPDLPV